MLSGKAGGSWIAKLFQPVDISSLVYFRIAFGAVMLWEVKRYFDHRWISRYWIDPDFHFSYFLFDWVKPWPGDGMIIHFYVLGALSLFIMVGLFYRLSATLFFLGFTHVFLLDQARYLNHFYLVSLISFLMIFVPAHRSFSIDSMVWPRLRTQTTPVWAIWLLQFQIGVAYFFGGVAKLNLDWLRGEPMRAWLASRTAFPLIGQWFTEEWAVYLFSYGGLLLDLCAVPLLLWSKTRPYIFIPVVLFHLLNDRLFSIGIFPWFMIVATAIYFPPGWPRRLYSEFWVTPSRAGAVSAAGAVVGVLLAAWFNTQTQLIPLLAGATAGALAAWTFATGQSPSPASGGGATQDFVKAHHNERVTTETMEPTPAQVITAVLLLAWAAVHVGVPLRHYFIPGNVSWTEEGHNFAWHMKLRGKRGVARFFATNPADGATWEIDPRQTLTPRQYRKMSTRPHLIHQFARHLAKELEAQGRSGVEIRVRAEVSLNGRRRQLLIDPTVDLASQPSSFGHAPWILPLTEPLTPP